MHALGSDTCMDGSAPFYKLVLSSLILKYFKLHAHFHKSDNYFSLFNPKINLSFQVNKSIL